MLQGEALDLIAERRIETHHGPADEFLFRHANAEIVALGIGAWRGDPTLLRIHSSCFSAHYLGCNECDCREQLEIAFDMIGAHGGGLVIFLDQDGRGNGHAAWMRSSAWVRGHGGTVGDAYEALGYPRDARDYKAIPLVIRALGLSRIILLTNNPDKVLALSASGIDVEKRAIVADGDAWLRLAPYYHSKRSEGHSIPEV